MTGFLALSASAGYAQLTKANRQILKESEQSLLPLAYSMVNGITEDQRQESNDKFIPLLVKSLKTPGSFYYRFDSLRQISIVYPKDSSFRIFSWGIFKDAGQYRYYGAIQVRTADGGLRLFPFFDNGEYTEDVSDTITSNKAWIGCIYYNILEKQAGGKKYYTLFGWQGNNYRSHKKLLDVLSFRDREPVFGAPIFSLGNGNTQNRFILEYKTDASVGLNYDPELGMIVYDHLVSLNNQPSLKYTYVPDGTYEGFKWESGKWVHVDRIFNDKQQKTSFPSPVNFKKNILEKDTIRK